MIRLSVLILFAAVLPAQGQNTGTWQVLPNSPVADGRHDDVFFVSADTGWVVNTAGEIYKTNDGGDNWELQYERNRIFFRSIGFATGRIGWAGNLGPFNNPTMEDVLFETRDGGQTWSNITDRISGPIPAGICGLWVVNEQTIFGLGRWNGPALFIKSTDGGLSWTSKDMSSMVTGLIDAYFFDDLTGMIVGGRGVGSTLEEQNSSHTVILYTEDGGETWEERYSSTATGKWGWKFSFPTPDIGYLATQGPNLDGVVLKTTDGGASWQELVVGENLGFSGIGFATAEIGWVGADATTHQTLDGGITWETINLGEQINRFRMFGDTLGYAVGRQVYKYTASTSTHRDLVSDVPSSSRLLHNYPNPFAHSTSIEFTITRPGPVRLRIYNPLGIPVATLFDQTAIPGTYQVTWYASGFPGGLYFSRLEEGEQTQVGRLILVK